MAVVGPGGESFEEREARFLAAAAPHLATMAEALNRSLLPALQAAQEWIEAARPALVEMSRHLAAAVSTPEFQGFLLRVREARPPNWPSPVDLKQVTAAIQDDGIPLVWVPRPELVNQIVRAPDRAARVEILLEHIDLVLEDCRRVLDEATEPMLAPRLPLARAAVDALADGHGEAAQALATVVTETAVAGIRPGAYKDVREEIRAEAEDPPWDRMRLAMALAPIHRFYTPWYSHWKTAPPDALSRHVSVHNADVNHYTPGNALISVMLVTSVLRAVQEQLHGTGDELESR